MISVSLLVACWSPSGRPDAPDARPHEHRRGELLVALGLAGQQDASGAADAGAPRPDGAPAATSGPTRLPPIVATPRVAPPTLTPGAEAQRALRLVITSSGARRVSSVTYKLALRARITNTGKTPVTFHFERCGSCFWAISFNGAAFAPASRAVHAALCPFSTVVRLQPRETRTIDWIRAYPATAEVQGLRTVRLRYRLDAAGTMLESNELALPAPSDSRGGRAPRGCGCSFGD